ncbi:hypothetical protein FOZ62_012078, partial [Perkinsus olseni]
FVDYLLSVRQSVSGSAPAKESDETAAAGGGGAEVTGTAKGCQGGADAVPVNNAVKGRTCQGKVTLVPRRGQNSVPPPPPPPPPADATAWSSATCYAGQAGVPPPPPPPPPPPAAYDR